MKLTFKPLIAFPLLITGNLAYGETLQCQSLQECVDNFGALEKKSYISSEKLKSNDFRSLNLSGSLSELDNSMSFILNQNGYTRVPQPGGKLTYIVPTRDIRYNPTPLYDSNDVTKIPLNYDYFMVKHKLKNRFLSSDITKSLRPFMSRYGRIIDQPDGGQIILQDTGRNIHRLLELIKDFDVELTKEELKEVKRDHERRKKHARQLQIIRAKRGGD